MVKTIVKAGLPFAFGSDGPINPYLNMMFAAINPTNPAEALTIEQSLAAYTRGAAFAEFAEGQKGTLAPGCWPTSRCSRRTSSRCHRRSCRRR